MVNSEQRNVSEVSLLVLRLTLAKLTGAKTLVLLED